MWKKNEKKGSNSWMLTYDLPNFLGGIYFYLVTHKGFSKAFLRKDSQGWS